MYYFCTYFDSNYLTRGLALHESLCKHANPFHLWILCLDDVSFDFLSKRKLLNVSLIQLSDIENWDARLRDAKNNRSKIEYYFTLSPFFPSYVLKTNSQVDLVTYLDADLYFYSDVGPIFKELGNNSILIIGHKFSAKNLYHEKYGSYNVGFLSFRRDVQGEQCLASWQGKCLEWCSNRSEGDRFADQKYLDKWPQQFKNVIVLQNKGANVAPWNLDNYKVRHINGKIYIDDSPLIFYHFHDLYRLHASFYLTGLQKYYTRLNKTVANFLYIPYIKKINGFGIETPVREIKIAKTANIIKYAMQNLRIYKFLRNIRWYLKGQGMFVKR